MEFIDSHAHLAYDRFVGDEADLVARARAAGVVHMVNPGITESSVAEALALADRFPGFITVGVGIHPNDAQSWQPETYARFKALAADPRVVAVGETGLDYFREHCPPAIQQTVLREHVRLAREIGRPLIIHTRDAHEDLLQLLTEENADEVGGVMHCFSGDLALAERSMALNFYISFAGNLTYKNAKNLHEAAAKLPLDRLLIETDAPFLTPIPHRGERNEPSLVVKVAEMIAQLQGCSVADVAAATTANARRLFRLPGAA
ncbi:MAG: TatD family hydrolase [Candidatus Sericytochromatia bacterium]|nr:TatD family hydrolase [Candidatus Sericytochromatia bacterium]